MFCPGCGAANVDGAKFCGACGARIEAAVPVSGGRAPAASATTPTVARMPAAPVRYEPSGASLAPVPASGRGARLALVLGLDLGLVVAGVALWTQPAKAPATTTAQGGSDSVATGSGGASGDVDAPTVGGGSSTGGGGHGGGNTGGGGNPTSTGVGGTGGGSTASTGSGSGSPGGGSSGSGSTGDAIDARSIDDRLTDAPAAPTPPAPDAATPVVAPALDAAPAAPPPLIDAASVTPPPIDAAASDEVGANQIQAEFTHLAVTSESRFGRCYQTATKALPDDQPLVGEVDIALSVMPTGQTDNVRIQGNTTGSQTLADCALGVVRSWTFSPHDGAGPLQFSRVFRFGPAQ
ncbi:MAG: zinc-ribbon domain-containing protein [Myxococcales bacterium]|nr:zinc-ribbon domain-containing protein [Myxococcales bacterium]